MTPRSFPADPAAATDVVVADSVANDAVSIRPFDTDTDYEPIAELISRTNAFDDLDWFMTVPALRAEVAEGRPFNPETAVRVAELEGERSGIIRMSSRARGQAKVVHRMDLWTAPEQRRLGVGRRLLAWAEDRARGVMAEGSVGAPDAVHEMSLAIEEGNAASAAFAEARGYHVIRYSFEMRRQLDEPIPDAPLPPGLELRPVVEANHRRIWDASVEAFRDHWEASARTEDDYRNWFTDPDLDTSIWQIAWDGDEVAGVSMNTIYAEENERLGIKVGWLDQVAVRRPWRRRGVGAAIIAASMRTFRERGLAEASLGVDAENPTGALALYEGLGFTRHRSFRIYRKRL